MYKKSCCTTQGISTGDEGVLALGICYSFYFSFYCDGQGADRLANRSYPVGVVSKGHNFMGIELASL